MRFDKIYRNLLSERLRDNEGVTELELDRYVFQIEYQFRFDVEDGDRNTPSINEFIIEKYDIVEIVSEDSNGKEVFIRPQSKEGRDLIDKYETQIINHLDEQGENHV